MADYNNGSEYIPGSLKVDGNTVANTITANSITAGVFSVTAGTTPANPVEGQIFANSTSHHIYAWNGSAWAQLDN